MKGQYENKLVKIAYENQLNGSFKVKIRLKTDCEYIGEVGHSKQFSLFVSTAGGYDYKTKELRLIPECTDLSIKEKDFDFILKNLQSLSEVLNSDKAVEIDKVKYYKHDRKNIFMHSYYKDVAMLEEIKAQELSDMIDTAKNENYLRSQISEHKALSELFKAGKILISSDVFRAELLTDQNESFLSSHFFDGLPGQIYSAEEIYIKYIHNTEATELKSYLDQYLIKNKIRVVFNFESDNIIKLRCYDQEEFNRLKSLNLSYKDFTLRAEFKDYFFIFGKSKLEQITEQSENVIICSPEPIKENPIKESQIDYSKRDYKPTEFKDAYPNAGRKFTAEDEEKLEFLYKAGKSIQDLSEIFGRTESAIKIKLRCLGLLVPENFMNSICNPIKESAPAEVPEVINCIKEPEPIKESKQEYILKTKIRHYNHIKDIIININKYTDKYLSLTGSCYYIKELIKRHKGKFYYSLPGLKNAWIIPTSEVRSLIAEIKN